MVADVKIGLPHPRNRKSAPFLAKIDRVYALLAGQTEAESVELGSAPGEPGRTRPLPDVSTHEIAGLVERLDEMASPKVDIYHLTAELRIESDHLLRLVEAAELLGFATVAQGDITLTTLGETFAEASILGRKAIFAARLRRMPLFRWVLSLLTAARNHQLDRAVFRTALELEFPHDTAEKQVDIVVDWGRYAEILAYDDANESFYLEPAVAPAT